MLRRSGLRFLLICRADFGTIKIMKFGIQYSEFGIQNIVSDIEEIKNKLNILDIVGGYIKLTKTGINYRGLCPFHSEKTPSFFVSPTRQTWHCFGCGAGFSIFDFVMKIEGVEFGDALRILAAKAGVELKRENPQLRTERQRLYEICELAARFFEKQMESAAGKEVEEYLLSRGISKESVKKWRLGYSPDSWRGLSDFLVGKGYGRDEIIKTGLAIPKENNPGESYDRFRGRIMFPVFDPNSQVVGFGGRIFKQAGEDGAAKYINTPQTLLYDKSGVLYGLNNAKVAVRKQNQCVITEGYTDVIMCHQSGYENTVASSGTALTSRHLNILKRYSENLILAFDMDVAGDSATKRGINMAQEQGFNIKIIGSYGANEKKSDPADIIAKNPEVWQECLDNSKSIMDYYFDFALGRFDKNSPEGKREIGKIILPAVKRLQNKIEQSHWAQKLASVLGVKEEAVMEEMAKVKEESFGRAENYSSAPLPDLEVAKKGNLPEEKRKKMIEERIISLILKDPKLALLVEDCHYPLFSVKVAEFIAQTKKIMESSPEGPSKENIEIKMKEIFEKAAPSGAVEESLTREAEADFDFQNFLAALAMKGDWDEEKNGEEEIKICLAYLKNIEIKSKLNKISQDIKTAELQKEHEKIKSLMEKFGNLAKEL